MLACRNEERVSRLPNGFPQEAGPSMFDHTKKQESKFHNKKFKVQYIKAVSRKF